MKITKWIVVLLAAAAPALGLVNIKAGYTSTMGELGDRYKGGVGALMELEIGLPGPLAIVPMGGYTQLGKDQQFKDLLFHYIDQYWPPGVPLPGDEHVAGPGDAQQPEVGLAVQGWRHVSICCIKRG